ncbi:MAG: xanthine dehydrogenase family protein subunit M, partial [Anaerolineales bacterium]|nr:xanthine dehydrogenase family protein subunit M [Anaerolineales bacterium]
TTIEQALDHLTEFGYDAKVLAGGQSLIPMMNFRLAQPSVLVDLNRVPELSYIEAVENGGLRIGAMTRHHQVEYDPLVAERAPLIHATMPGIATPQIRSRGTFGGSIAHADPAAELTAVSVVLDGQFRVQSRNGERWVPASDFFVGMFTTVLEPDELLTEISFPPLAPRTGWAMQEVARRAGDFALVGVAAVVTLDNKNLCDHARMLFFSVGDGPVEAHQAVDVLKGQEPSLEVIRAASEKVDGDIDPGSDIHASADYRRHLAKVLAYRTLEQAFDRAKEDA